MKVIKKRNNYLFWGALKLVFDINEPVRFEENIKYS